VHCGAPVHRSEQKKIVLVEAVSRVTPTTHVRHRGFDLEDPMKLIRSITVSLVAYLMLVLSAPKAGSQYGDPRTIPGPAFVASDGVCYSCYAVGHGPCPCQILPPQS